MIPPSQQGAPWRAAFPSRGDGGGPGRRKEPQRENLGATAGTRNPGSDKRKQKTPGPCPGGEWLPRGSSAGMAEKETSKPSPCAEGKGGNKTKKRGKSQAAIWISLREGPNCPTGIVQPTPILLGNPWAALIPIIPEPAEGRPPRPQSEKSDKNGYGIKRIVPKPRGFQGKIREKEYLGASRAPEPMPRGEGKAP